MTAVPEHDPAICQLQPAMAASAMPCGYELEP